MGARNQLIKNIRRQVSRLGDGAKQLARDIAGWLDDVGNATAPAPKRAYTPVPVYSPEEERRQRARQRKRK